MKENNDVKSIVKRIMNKEAGKYGKFLAGALLMALAFGYGCKKAYTPKIISSGGNYLVVEGVINTGPDASIIRLSRTVPLSSNLSAKPETGAIINIISDGGLNYPVIEQGNGTYIGAIINSNAAVKYSIKIVTSNGEVYQSDFVSSKNSPPIDSVYYRVKSDGINIYSDTHDATNSSRYYRWEFTDTYLFHSAYNSYGYYSKYPVDTVLARPQEQQIYACFRSDTSTSIILNSTAKLVNDVVAANLISTIPSTSEKIANRYTIQVKQYVLTPDAFNYYQQLKNNTESLGTIFDPQPSELPGNIHCQTNPAEVVIGYITAGTPSKTRIFIDNHNLPNWRADNYYGGCTLDSDYYVAHLSGGGTANQVAAYIFTGYHIPVLPIAVPRGPILGWSASLPSCVDCTLRGTNIRPGYWIDAGN